MPTQSTILDEYKYKELALH